MEARYCFDELGNRVYLTEEEIGFDDAIRSRLERLLWRQEEELLALRQVHVAFRDRVLARAAAERAAKP